MEAQQLMNPQLSMSDQVALPHDTPNRGLSTGAKVGIAIGVIVALLVTGLIAYTLLAKKVLALDGTFTQDGKNTPSKMKLIL